jgi:hypothetical protein
MILIIRGINNNNKNSSSSHETIIDVNDWLFTNEYLQVHLMNETTRTRRGFAIVGQYDHGKTSLIGLLV